MPAEGLSRNSSGEGGIRNSEKSPKKTAISAAGGAKSGALIAGRYAFGGEDATGAASRKVRATEGDLAASQASTGSGGQGGVAAWRQHGQAACLPDRPADADIPQTQGSPRAQRPAGTATGGQYTQWQPGEPRPAEGPKGKAPRSGQRPAEEASTKGQHGPPQPVAPDELAILLERIATLPQAQRQALLAALRKFFRGWKLGAHRAGS